MSGRVGARALLAVAAREAAERWALLGLAVIGAAVPLVAPYVPIGDRPFFGVFLAVVIVLATVVLTGSSVIARDLAEGRLGFFLARPVPWWSIWGGKVLAAVVLTFTVGAIVLVPATRGEVRLPPPGWWLIIAIPGLLALFGIVHAAAVAYRGRSPWFVADLALAGVSGWIVARTSRGLLQAGVDVLHPAFPSVALWTLAVAFTAAGAAQVAHGRTDIRRGHRVLSVVAWSIVLPAMAAYAGWAAWVRRPSPRDLASIVSADAAPSGPWIAVSGHVRRPRPAMIPMLLFDPGTGRSVTVSTTPFVSGPVFSADGRRAAWFTYVEPDDPALLLADLAGDDPRAQRVPMPVPPGRVLGLALAPRGDDVAVVQESQTSVFRIGSLKPGVVAPVRVAAFARSVAFSPDGRAHTLGGPSDALAARALAVVVLDPSRGLYRVGETIPVRGDAFAEWGPGAERVTILDRQDRRPSLSLHDGTTGARLATLAADGTADSVSSTFLADGRVAVVEVHHAVRLRVFTRDGSESLSLEIAPRLAFVRPVEVAPGIVAVEIRNLEAFDTWTSVLVDVDHARVLRTERGLRPAPSSWYARVSGTTLVPSRLFIDDAGALVRLDLATGAREKLLGG